VLVAGHPDQRIEHLRRGGRDGIEHEQRRDEQRGVDSGRDLGGNGR
jgi:hypothetical protein